MSSDENVTRIGRGVPMPAVASQPTVPRRRTAWLLVGAGLFIGAGVTGVLFAGQIFSTSQAGSPPQVPMPAASSPSLKVLDVEATCVLLVPTAVDAATAVADVIADPNAADWPKVQKAYDDLELIAAIAAPELRDDIGQTSATLSQMLALSRTGGKLTFDMADFKAAGLRIGARCAKYAR